MDRRRSPLRYLRVSFLGALLVLAACAIERQAPVGETTVVVRDVTALLGDDVRRLSMPDRIYENERIESGVGSATEIRFRDGTILTIGPETVITLDSIVFDPDSNSRKFLVTIERGVVRVVTGDTPSSAYRVTTPVATFGVRGKTLNLLVREEPGEAQPE